MAKKTVKKRTDKNKQHKKDKFLVAYAESGNLSDAARVAGCDRNSHYLWLRDSNYEEKFQDAKEQAIEKLEMIARERAFKSSDVLLIFLLKSLKPDIYKDRREVENTGVIDVNVKTFERFIQLKEQAKKELDAEPNIRIKPSFN